MFIVKEKKDNSLILTSNDFPSDVKFLSAKLLQIGWTKLDLKPPNYIEIFFDDISFMENFIDNYCCCM